MLGTCYCLYRRGLREGRAAAAGAAAAGSADKAWRGDGGSERGWDSGGEGQRAATHAAAEAGFSTVLPLQQLPGQEQWFIPRSDVPEGQPFHRAH